jgi:hypothetical protein
VAESFLTTLKTDHGRLWQTKMAARIEVGRWIEDRIKEPHNPCPRNGGRVSDTSSGSRVGDLLTKDGLRVA